MRCEVCGNDYDKPLEITYLGKNYVFDCFECAVSKLAPICASCGTTVMGHGMEVGGEIFCSAHCARRAGHGQMRDRA